MNAALMTSTELAAGFEIEPNGFFPETRRAVDFDLEPIRHERLLAAAAPISNSIETVYFLPPPAHPHVSYACHQSQVAPGINPRATNDAG